MIELTVTKTTNDSGATEFRLSPDALQLGAKAADHVDQLHIAVPADWDGCQIRITIRQRYIAPVARIVPVSGTVDISADMLQQSNGTITIDAAKADYHAYTNDICWTAYQHSAAGSASVPQPSEYQQIVGLCQSALETAANALAAANDDQSTASQASATAQQALSDFLAMLGTDVASLVGGKIPMSQIPATATQEIYEVAVASDLTGLVAQRGDLAELVEIVNGERTVTKTWQLLGDDATVAANWVVWGTSYAVQAGNATTAASATTAAQINGHRMVEMNASEFANAVKDPDTYYLVFEGAAG